MSNLNERAAHLGKATWERLLRGERKRQSNPKGGLLAFIRYFWEVLEPATPFVEGWVLEMMCSHLEAVTRGEQILLGNDVRKLNRLLVNVPPGFMKSMLVNIFWPAWEWGPMNMPHLRYVAFSYASELTERDNQKFRDLVCCDAYREMWGHVFKVVGDGKIRVTNDKTGSKFASSMGGVGTGERGDRVLCLPGSERVLTDRGWLAIAEIVEQRLPVKVAGFDHENGDTIWQDIEAYERNPGNEIIEVACEVGVVRCTRDHPIFIQGRGYARADSLEGGDELVWVGRSFPLPPLPEGDQTQAKPATQILQSRLPEKGRERTCPQTQQSSVRDVRQADLPASSSFGEVEGALLQPQVLRCGPTRRSEPRIPRRNGCSHLSLVRSATHSQAEGGQTRRMLLTRLRHAIEVGAGRLWVRAYSIRKNLRVLQARVQAALAQDAVLFESMRGQGARLSYAGHGQWALCAWERAASISSRMDADAQNPNQEARWIQVQALRTSSRQRPEPGCAPHRLRQGQFAAGESDHALSFLPWPHARLGEVASGLERTTVCAVRTLRHEPVTYNLRVAPGHNYFAEGILVHNCDDIHKIKAGESDEARKSVVQWVREAMSNRLNSLADSAIVMIMQRTNEGDTSGAIMSYHSREYCHLIIPMEFQPGRHLTHLHGWVDPRQHEGDLAWPERYGARELASFKANHYLWAGQYQQDPAPRGGGLFKAEWWVPYVVPESGQYEGITPPLFAIAVLDTAFKEKEEDDYSALTVWWLYDDPKTKFRKVILVDSMRKRLPLHGPRVVRGQAEDEKTYYARAMPKWGLCEWVNFYCTKRGVNRLLIEDSARGTDVNNEIKRLYGARPWGVHLVPVRGDKWSRAHACVDIFTDDMVQAPGDWICSKHQKAHCPTCPDEAQSWWWRDFARVVIDEMSVFPRGAHDDLVDTCLTGDTCIVTARGVVPIAAVRVGDLVMTHKGRWRSVTRVGSRQSDHHYRLKAKGLEEIKITGEHPALVMRVAESFREPPFKRPRELRWEKVENLTPRRHKTFVRRGMQVRTPMRALHDTLVLPRGTVGALVAVDLKDYWPEAVADEKWVYTRWDCPHRIPDEVTSQVARMVAAGSSLGATAKRFAVSIPTVAKVRDGAYKPRYNKAPRFITLGAEAGWAMGLFLAEGCVSHDKINYACDRAALDRVRRWAVNVLGCASTVNKGAGAHRFTICCRLLVPLFESFGRGAQNKVIPAWVFDAPDEFIRGLIDGFSYGDGHQSQQSVSLTSTSRSLLWGMRLLLARLGMPAWIGTGKPAGEREIFGRTSECLEAHRLDYQLAPSGCAVVSDEYIGTHIEVVERIDGNVDVFNLTVEEDESYVTVGGTLHNCTMALNHMRKEGLLIRRDEKYMLDQDEAMHMPSQTPLYPC